MFDRIIITSLSLSGSESVLMHFLNLVLAGVTIAAFDPIWECVFDENLFDNVCCQNKTPKSNKIVIVECVLWAFEVRC